MELDRNAAAILAEMAAAAKTEPAPRGFAERLAKARRDAAGLARFSAPAPAEVTAENVAVAGLAPIRLYRPPGSGPSRLLLWFHGGGTIAGSTATHEPVLMTLAGRTGRAVASLDYTLAPEAVFPVQHDECLAAAMRLPERARDLGLDPSGWAIGGDSIGGLYATATAIALRDGGHPAPSAQVLVYPNTDIDEDRRFASLEENEGRVMTRGSLRFEAETAVPSKADRAGPRASPLRSADLSGLPPAYVATCEADPLRDEGEAYAARLHAAGVALRHRRFPGMIHAFMQMNARVPAATTLMDEIGAFLREGGTGG